MHYLAVCAIFRDEARYLAEWLTHYELQGVEHFYLYDDQSTDHPEKVLAPWVARGMVTLEPVRWASRRQAHAYSHCIRMRRKEAHWIGFFDIDELPSPALGPKPWPKSCRGMSAFPDLESTGFATDHQVSSKLPAHW
ncbi:glycosyltransferase family 92 protein [Nisaea sp.]|uniref:glycosyltransferase family 92 protein n=1 Tax=Nisaea sp. TaxID=2024842 RepID=UPI0032ECC692